MDRPTVHVVTRLGIGIADRERCLFRVGLLAHTILRSLSRQTRPVHWVIVHDARMHDDARQELANLLAPYPTFETAERDPLTGGMGPMTPDVCGRVAGGILCRIDDDDLVALDYAERVERALTGRQAPFAVTFPDGFDACPEQGVVAPKRSPWLAHSLATLSGDELFNPYATRHARVGEVAVERGGGSEIIEGPPAWVYLRRSSSNGLEKRPFRFRGDRHEPDAMDRALAPFGAEPGWTRSYLDLLTREPRNPPLFDEDGHNTQGRLLVKNKLLSLIRQEQPGDTRRALVSAFYAI